MSGTSCDTLLLSQTRFGFGALCIFLYVGGEVAIGSIIVNYLGWYARRPHQVPA